MLFKPNLLPSRLPCCSKIVERERESLFLARALFVNWMEAAAVSVSATATETTTEEEYVRWVEVVVSGYRGKGEVHYYLKKRDGSSDLAVVGKEKKSWTRNNNMYSYHYAIRNRSLISPSSSPKSRREVVDWLNSIVTESTHESSLQAMDLERFKDTQLRKLGLQTKEFFWIGSSCTGRKRRNHYQSFRRNGVQISVHDFVYVLAEEDKRLVAYLEDMYEDSKGKKMVVVRWFHKIDEVGIVLPRNFNDREIFFSLCLQDLSVECIDGLATVLSPEHFDKFLNEATHTQLEPFVCWNQFENVDVKPFDVTKVKGYWKQEILRFMQIALPPKASVKTHRADDALNIQENTSGTVGSRQKNRHRRSRESDAYLQCSDNQDLVDVPFINVQDISNSLFDCKIETDMSILKESCSDAPLSDPPQHLVVGSQVEVLSQDSGIRGCWFRAWIIKNHKDKVKVRYQDIQDAEDETKGVEEWLLSSRVAHLDQLGLRLCGRTTIRPAIQSNTGSISRAVDVGAAVDVWWHDGWWEGLVIQKESKDKIRVYFPGEKQTSVFGCANIRHSYEWLENKWRHINDRQDLVTNILSNLEAKRVVVNYIDNKAAQDTKLDSRQPVKIDIGHSPLRMNTRNDNGKGLEVVPDLSRDGLLAQLKWNRNTSKKRSRGSVSSVQKADYGERNRKRSPEAGGSRSCERFLIPSSLKLDLENCKYIGDSLFSTSVVPTLTSLVMSR